MNYTDGIVRKTEFFTTTELAEKLKMNVQVITRKVQAGEIRAYKIGKDWRIPEQAVHAWLEERSNQNGKVGKRRATAAAESLPRKSDPAPVVAGQRTYLLEYIIAQFEPEKSYSESDVNSVISRYSNEPTLIREEFINVKMMVRSDGNYFRRPGYRFLD